jgi:hypothetical protein
MKTINHVLLFLAVTTLALAGCGKSSKDTANAANPMTGVAILQKSFPAPSPELQASIGKIYTGIRYGEYAIAQPELDKVAADPSLNDAQKKAVSDLTEQLKKAIAAAPPKPQ